MVKKGYKVFFKNQLKSTVQVCAGLNEYVVEPEEEKEIEVQDGDHVYVDPWNFNKMEMRANNDK